jgi:hypothetical protein
MDATFELLSDPLRAPTCTVSQPCEFTAFCRSPCFEKEVAFDAEAASRRDLAILRCLRYRGLVTVDVGASLLRLTLLALVLLSTGCSLFGPKFQPLVAHRVWEQSNTEKVFDAAVRVLHSSDYLIASADKKSGLIATDWKQFAVSDTKFRIRLNLLVLKETETSVALSYKSRVQARPSGGSWNDIEADDPVDSDGYKRLTNELDDFFLEIQRYAGPSTQRR